LLLASYYYPSFLHVISRGLPASELAAVLYVTTRLHSLPTTGYHSHGVIPAVPYYLQILSVPTNPDEFEQATAHDD
jgi:hypothetical protein